MSKTFGNSNDTMPQAVQKATELAKEIGSKEKLEYYKLDRILKKKCQYNLIIGERSNGKTYACLDYALERFFKHGEQTAYLRRYREDFRGKRGDSLFANHVGNGRVKHHSNDEYETIKYYAGRWFPATIDPDTRKLVSGPDPFCFGFSLSEIEHDKSTAYPNITTIIFDEFLTRGYYLPNEFVTLMNCLSTIIRHRNNVTIFLLGNTVNKYCPYFKEMGLSHVAEMEQGKIDVYHYGDSGLRVAVERCSRPKQGVKKSDVYFAFDNPELEMITGGAWEIAMYPHCPVKYKPSDVVGTYFMEFNDNLLQCEIVAVEDVTFTFIHEKTTPLRNKNEDLIFTEEYSPRPNYRRNIMKPHDDVGRRIKSYFDKEKVFYQDNEVGEIVRNYIKWCRTPSQM